VRLPREWSVLVQAGFVDAGASRAARRGRRRVSNCDMDFRPGSNAVERDTV